MLDFSRFRAREQTLQELAEGLTVADLRRHTADLYDALEQALDGMDDFAVTFVPEDPNANDPGAPEEERTMPWTLAHVVAHVTAGTEEAAFLAAELARGVKEHGRSRYETPWRTITTAEQVRQRVAESRRMALATFDIWPDQPHLDNVYELPREIPGFPKTMNAPLRLLLGLSHHDGHLAQVRDILRQAAAAR
ncbi:MAG: DinB family protein [Dehalococcoidia bacterium]|nr:DinB family protein [Dehalococcoidia bacterium]